MLRLKAKPYEQVNHVQRYDAQQIMTEFSRIFRWRLDGKDSLLDIGTGSGDVLMDIIRPSLPRNFKNIIGSDLSAEMIEHCNAVHKSGHLDKVDFEILDIETEKLPKEFINEFDHVTSFYCLHWIKNQRQAMGNIYDMLHTKGDCLLVFLEWHPFFDINKILSNTPKWAPHMKDIKCYTSKLFRNNKAEFRRILKDVGFVECSVEIRDRSYAYEGLDALREFSRAVSPYIDRVPSKLHEEFLDDTIDHIIELNLHESMTDGVRFIIPYRLFVIYARK